MISYTRTDCTGKCREYTGDIYIDITQFSDHDIYFIKILERNIADITGASSRILADIVRIFTGHQILLMEKCHENWLFNSYESLESFWRFMVAEYHISINDSDLAKVIRI